MAHPMQRAAPPLDFRSTGYALSIVINAFLIYLAHHLLAWQVPILTSAFTDVLWSIDLSLGATIVARAIFFMGYDAAWFRHLGEAVLDVFALLSVYTIYRVFPFQFDQAWWYDVASLVLVVLIGALLIAVVVNAIRALADGVPSQA